MTGCVHLLTDSYRKRSMQEFLRLLSDSVAVENAKMHGSDAGVGKMSNFAADYS